MEQRGKYLGKRTIEIQGASGPFTKTTFWLDVSSNGYDNINEFEFIRDKLDLSGVEVGSFVNVKFNLQGRRWKDAEGKEKIFQHAGAWSIENKTSASQQTKEHLVEQSKERVNQVDVEDDLPF